MSKMVRVKQTETGHELSVDSEWAERFAEGYDVLDKPAVSSTGDPLPPKYRTSVSSEAEKKKAASAEKKGN